MMTDEKRNIKARPEPYLVPFSDILVTEEELERRKRKYYRLKSIGVNPTIITDDTVEAEYENPYRIQAMIIISRDEDVPDALIEKIKQYDLEHGVRFNE